MSFIFFNKLFLKIGYFRGFSLQSSKTRRKKLVIFNKKCYTQYKFERRRILDMQRETSNDSFLEYGQTYHEPISSRTLT